MAAAVADFECARVTLQGGANYATVTAQTVQGLWHKLCGSDSTNCTGFVAQTVWQRRGKPCGSGVANRAEFVPQTLRIASQ